MSPTGKASAVRKGLAAAVTSSAAVAPENGRASADLPVTAAAVPPSQRPKPPKPTRFTLDLDAARHRFLKDYATEIEARGAADVLRALLDELQADPELAVRVRTRVWSQE